MTAKARLVLALLGVLLFAGCIATRVVRPEPDTFAQWTDHPQAPDPALAAIVLGGHSSCGDPQNPAPIRILLQDRRTPFTAAFLFLTPTTFGGCVVSSASGGSSGGSGPIPPALTGPLSIDDQGSGTAANGTITELGGRIGVDASQVVIELADGKKVFASVANGYWLGWWPSETAATRVVALDAAGAEVASLAVTK